jgi:hypothetical protein
VLSLLSEFRFFLPPGGTIASKRAIGHHGTAAQKHITSLSMLPDTKQGKDGGVTFHFPYSRESVLDLANGIRNSRKLRKVV